MTAVLLTDADTDAVMAAGVDVIRAYRSLDHHVGRSIQAVTFAEIRWSELMRSWMAARGIAQTDDEAAR